jgi:hypothetical protein
MGMTALLRRFCRRTVVLPTVSPFQALSPQVLPPPCRPTFPATRGSFQSLRKPTPSLQAVNSRKQSAPSNPACCNSVNICSAAMGLLARFVGKASAHEIQCAAVAARAVERIQPLPKMRGSALRACNFSRNGAVKPMRAASHQAHPTRRGKPFPEKCGRGFAIPQIPMFKGVLRISAPRVLVFFRIAKHPPPMRMCLLASDRHCTTFCIYQGWLAHPPPLAMSALCC